MISRLDPTRTRTLQRALASRIRSRLAAVYREVRELIVVEDAMALRPENQPHKWGVRNVRYRALTDSAKADRFADYLRESIGRNLLDDDVWKTYVQRGYLSGAGRAYDTVRRKHLREAKPYASAKAEFMGQAVQVERIKRVVGRVYRELEGVGSRMEVEMTRILADGLAAGDSSETIGGALAASVKRLGDSRSRLIARTEVARANAEGALDAMEALGVDRIGVAIEWTTSHLGRTAKGNPSPCPMCKPLDGILLTVKEARGMFPRHPNCLCSPIPARVGEGRVAGRKVSKRLIDRAIGRSLKAERPKETIREGRKNSRWVGAGRRIAKKRPGTQAARIKAKKRKRKSR